MMNLFQIVTERLAPEKNFDVYTRRIKVSFGWINLVFLSSLIDTQLVLEAVQSIKKVKNQLILDQRLNVPQIQEEKDVDLLITCFYNGELLIFYKDKAFHADCKKLPVRGIDEPYSEKAIRGSRDGFNENLNTNIALIRLRLKSEKLHADLFTVSEYGKTAVCLAYLEDKANPEIVRELERRIRNLHIHSLIMTDRSLEEKLFRQGKIIYPLVRYTERPDVASIHIMNGKIVILVDTSSSALITPICLLDHLKHVEEFRQSPFIGSFTKFLRILSILVSLFLSPTVLALYIDHDFAHFFRLDTTLRVGDLAFQMLAGTMILEIFRIAVVHTPTPLVGAISLVSALVLGQVSIELGIFSNEMLLVVCISAICGFATPSYELSLSNKLVSLIFLLVVAFFRMEGYLIALIGLFLYLVSIRTFGVPYLYPVCPMDIRKLTGFLFRTSNDDKKNT